MNTNNNVRKTAKSDFYEQDSDKGYEISLASIARVLLERLWIIVLAGLIAAVAAYVYTANFVTPTYNSTARIYILNRQNSSATSVNDLTSAASIKEDFLVLVKSNEICRQVLTTIGEDPSQFRALKGRVSLDNNTSRFVDITVTDTDPLRAKMLVDAFADVCRARAKELMGVEDITIEEYGTIPTAPSAPSMSRNIVLAAMIGILLTAAIIVLIHIINDNITCAEDIEKNLGLCVLCTIPDISTLKRRTSEKKKKSGKV